MVEFKDLLAKDGIGPAAKVYLKRKLDDNDIPYSEDVSRFADLEDQHDSVLSPSDLVAILEQLPGDMKRYRANKLAAIEEPKKETGSLEEVAWHSITPTDSELGTRLIFGLKTSGCQYWKADKKGGIGCANCGYSEGTPWGEKITADQMVAQVRNILSQTQDQEYDVVVLANDGNIFANVEVSPKARKEIFELLKEQGNVKKVVVESRPKYITQDKVRKAMEALGPDKNLEIGMGLETTDLNIGHFCINKGYGKKEFEGALSKIAEVNDEIGGNRISALAYALLKPAYLTEEQAIEDVVKTGKYVAGLKEKFGVDVVMKMEPAVVPTKTLLEPLHEDGRYTPPSYWSVVEVISRLEKAGAAEGLRVGAREDMDDFKAIPANYHKIGMISQFDFIVYNSVQRYNSHRSIVKLLGDIEMAVDDDRSLEDWQESSGIVDPEFLNLYETHRDNIDAYQATDEFVERQNLYNGLFNVLDDLEYGSDIQESARESWRHDVDSSPEEIVRDVQWISHLHLDDARVQVRDLDLVPGGLELLRMRLDIDYGGETHAIWAGIPTAREVRLDEVQYVTN